MNFSKRRKIFPQFKAFYAYIVSLSLLLFKLMD